MASHALARAEAVTLVALGGFVGANLRYLTGQLLPGLAGTFAVNVLGSFLLGFLLYESVYTGVVSPEARLAVSTGFLSSFTTYSTFALQSARSPPALLVGNVLATYALGFAAVLVGRRVARSLGGAAAGGGA